MTTSLQMFFMFDMRTIAERIYIKIRYNMTRFNSLSWKIKVEKNMYEKVYSLKKKRNNNA